MEKRIIKKKSITQYANFLFILFLILFQSCKTEETKQTIKILFIGNSITHHVQASQIGWFGDWGMAASSRDNDYVHQLIKMLEDNYPNKQFDFKEQNVADWELNFSKDLNSYSDIINYESDVLIIRLGENVPEYYAQLNNYSDALEKLVSFYKTNTTSVIVTGNFWESKYKDNVQKQIAEKNNYYYVALSDLSNDKNNMALEEYDNYDVGKHPSDKGMKEIAIKIFNCIKANSIVK